MNLQTILVPIDYSACSTYAFEVAHSLAREQHGKIILLHVLEPIPEAGEALLAYSFEDSRVDEARKELDAIACAPPIPIERKLLRGDVVDQILQVAAESSADLIVIGTHGRRGVAHFLLGSVAEGVVRRAECPVLTVKKPTSSPPNSKQTESVARA